MKKAKKKTIRATKPRVRSRLAPAERERLIVEGAIQHFAERGFEGTTRELAQRTGIAQALLYCYFPSKEQLIERVYQDLFVKKWNAAWTKGLSDRSIGLADRLQKFYHEYVPATLEYAWMRIFIFSGLKGFDLNKRYHRILRDQLYMVICAELRATYGQPDFDVIPVTDLELELVNGLHGAIVYRGFREHIYGLTIYPDIEPILRIQIDAFVNYAAAAVYRLMANGTKIGRPALTAL